MKVPEWAGQLLMASLAVWNAYWGMSWVAMILGIMLGAWIVGAKHWENQNASE